VPLFVGINYTVIGRGRYAFFERIDLTQDIITATRIKNSGIPNTYARIAALSVNICTAFVTAPVKTAGSIAKVVVAVYFSYFKNRDL
jgi:hypothetical protein